MANFVNPTFDSNLLSWIAGKQPSDISNLSFWFDANQESYANNDAVGTVHDFANGNDATQSTPSAKPTFKTGTINSLPVFSFDGGDRIYNSAMTSIADQDYTFIDVVKHVTAGGYQSFAGLGYTGGSIFSFDPGGTTIITNTAGNGTFVTGTPPATGTAFIHYVRRVNSLTKGYMRINGGSETNGSPPNCSSIAGWILGAYESGGGQPFTGQLGEGAGFSANLSSQDEADIHSYLALKWGLTLGTNFGANVTRDTGIKYSGAASAKIVTAASTGTTPFYEIINPGDTRQYNLIAYAYTDGSAVTSSDVKLYYNGSAITTTYTSVGSGWYKLSATVTGANANRKCGVEAQTNKTVYVDSFDLSLSLISPLPSFFRI